VPVDVAAQRHVAGRRLGRFRLQRADHVQLIGRFLREFVESTPLQLAEQRFAVGRVVLRGHGRSKLEGRALAGKQVAARS